MTTQELGGAPRRAGCRPEENGFAAVIFDLDAVLANATELHVAAWWRLFDAAFRELSPDGSVAPFTIDDYRTHVEGRSHDDAIRAVLASRGLFPVGRTGDLADELTIRGMAERQRQLLTEQIEARGVAPLPSAVSLLHRLRSAGIAAGLVTRSPGSRVLLAAAGLDQLFSSVIDASDASQLHLPGPPATDLFQLVARHLGVSPDEAAVVEHTECGIRAAIEAGFARVIGVGRDGNRAQLQAAGADIVVADLAGLDVTAPVHSAGAWNADADMGPWQLTYTGYDPSTEGVREALCTLANGYWATRGAACDASADAVHYPGTYLAGVYNSVESEVDGTTVHRESIVNAPNWLLLTVHHADGTPIDADHGTLEEYRQELDLRRGLLTRTFVHRDPTGRSTRIVQRRLVCMAQRHLAGLETTIEPLNWSDTVRVRSLLDADVVNAGIAQFRNFSNRHLQPFAAQEPAPSTVLLETVTSQSHVHIAMAARSGVHAGRRALDVPARVIGDRRLTVGHELELALSAGVPVTVEKIVAVATSHDRAIASPADAALLHLQAAPDFATLLAAHEDAWSAWWDDFAIHVETAAQPALALHLHTFHVVQTVAGASRDADVGIGARGLHGEGYQGHVLWDEMFVHPLLTLRRPELTRDLLAYRFRRLPAARAAAAAAGLPGAMFPWQSGSDGRDVTPDQTYNPLAGRWLADTSHRQRHVGLAIGYTIVQYYQATADIGFLAEMGGELLIEICRLFAALPTYDPRDDRFHLDGMMGPDEFHDGYPGRAGSGLRDNVYTNVLTAWLLHRTGELLRDIDAHDCGRLRGTLNVTPTETAQWELLSQRLAVPLHADGVISQFEGYEHLPDLDWDSYRARYPNVGRLDLILDAEGDSTNNYRVGKQADVLMLFYLFPLEELRDVFARLGYPLSPEAVRATIDFYTRRTSHGSTLSRVVHAWVNARIDRRRAWHIFTEALQADLADTQGGTTREGVHLGAMAGTVDLVLRCFAGVETRADALSLRPALPPELTRVQFTVVYRGQQVKVDMTPQWIRLRLRPCPAEPIMVCVGDERAVLGPGDEYEARLAAVPDEL